MLINDSYSTWIQFRCTVSRAPMKNYTSRMMSHERRSKTIFRVKNQNYCIPVIISTLYSGCNCSRSYGNIDTHAACTSKLCGMPKYQHVKCDILTKISVLLKYFNSVKNIREIKSRTLPYAERTFHYQNVSIIVLAQLQAISNVNHT